MGKKKDAKKASKKEQKELKKALKKQGKKKDKAVAEEAAATAATTEATTAEAPVEAPAASSVDTSAAKYVAVEGDTLKTISIKMPSQLVAAADVAAASYAGGVSRSEYIRTALETFINGR